MKRGTVWFGSVIVVASGVVLGGAGCIASNNAPSAQVDAAVIDFDAASPSVDATTPDTSAPPASDAGGDTGAQGETDSAVTPEASVPLANIRFGWFATGSAVVHGGMPRIGPNGTGPNGGGLASDVCVAPHGTGLWQGPLLAGSGLLSGLPSLGLTTYFQVPPGQYDVRVISSGASCDTPDAGEGGAPAPIDYTNLPALPASASITVAIVDVAGGGSVPSPTALVLFDETTTTAGMAKLRLVNTTNLLGETVDFGLGGGVAYQPLFVGVAPGIDPNADPNGYREVPAAPGVDTSLVSPAAVLGSLSSSAYPLAAGSITTAFAVEIGTQVGLVTCADGQSTAIPGLTDCTLTSSPSLAEQSYSRFGNFIADPSAPDVDVCIKYHALSTYAGPLLGTGVDAGTGITGVPLSPPSLATGASVSGYFNVHGGFAYDVRLVAAGSTDCSTPIAPSADGLYAAPVGDTTLAAVGYLTVPADAGAPVPPVDAGVGAGGDSGPPSHGLSSVALAFQPFSGDEGSGSPAAVRMIHLATLSPQPFDVTGALTYADIPYGGLATSPGPVDGNGYATVSGSISFTVNDTIGGNFEAGDYTNLSPGSASTLFIYSYTNGGSAQVNVLSCDDSRIIGGVASCQILNGG
jgi:hypothetical protein